MYIKRLAILYFRMMNYEYADNYLKMLLNIPEELDAEILYIQVKVSHELFKYEDVLKGVKLYLKLDDELLKRRIEILEIGAQVAEDLEEIEDLIIISEKLSEVSSEPLPILEKIVKYSLFIKNPVKALENLYVMRTYAESPEILESMLSYADSVLRLSPDLDEAIRFIGMVLTDKEEYSAASVRFRSILKEDSEDREFLEYSIRAFLGSGLKKEAVDVMNILEKLLGTRTEKIELYDKIEKIGLSLGDEDILLDVYRNWRGIEELSPDKLKRYSVILLRRDRIDDAIDILEGLLKANEEDLENYVILFDIYFDLKKEESLRQLLRKFRYNFKSRLDDRLEYSIKFISLWGNDPEILEDIARIYEEKGDLFNKVQYIEEFLRAFKGDRLPYLFELSDDYVKLERHVDAINVLVKINERQPDDLEILYKLSKLYIAIDRHKIAFGIFKEILKKYPGEKKAYNSALDIVYHYQNQGELEDGLEFLFELITLFPQDPVLVEKLGDLYANLGRIDDSKKAYLKVVELDPSRIYISDKLNRLNILVEEAEIKKLKDKIEKLRGLKSDILKEEKNILELELAQRYKETGKYPEALELFLLIYKRSEKESVRAPAFDGLLDVSIRLKKYTFARDILRSGIEFEKAEPKIYLSILYNSFIIYEHLGEKKKCAQLGIEILSHDTEYRDIKKRLSLLGYSA
ncbi:MAG: hypothetical protein PHV06_02500 [bacterium]|nr:hypothetical protein [bacterium]